MTQLLPGPPYQDHIVLDGAVSPGLAIVKGAGTPRRWDVRDGYGVTGAVCVFTGQGLATFDVDIFAWTDAHFLAWPIFARLTLVNPPIGARPTSMSIQHPALQDPPLTVSQVVVTNVSQWEQDPDGGGLWCRTISFLEYRKPRPALVAPLEGVPPVNGVPIVPIDPEELAIQANTNAIRRLSGQDRAELGHGP